MLPVEGIMVRELRLARKRGVADPALDASDLPRRAIPQGQRPALASCEHRSVSKEGRIVCSKIVEGDPEVSPNLCRDCPFKTVDCGHLRFSLRLSSPSPLIVRFNGRTEVWDDDPPRLSFERAACAARVTPIHDPRACANCTLRQSLQAEPDPATVTHSQPGRVVAFPGREPALAAAGAD
jgi:hypothetical protein